MGVVKDSYRVVQTLLEAEELNEWAPGTEQMMGGQFKRSSVSFTWKQERAFLPCAKNRCQAHDGVWGQLRLHWAWLRLAELDLTVYFCSMRPFPQSYLRHAHLKVLLDQILSVHSTVTKTQIQLGGDIDSSNETLHLTESQSGANSSLCVCDSDEGSRQNGWEHCERHYTEEVPAVLRGQKEIPTSNLS